MSHLRWGRSVGFRSGMAALATALSLAVPVTARAEVTPAFAGVTVIASSSPGAAVTLELPTGASVGCELGAGAYLDIDHDGTFAVLVLESISQDQRLYGFVKFPEPSLWGVNGPGCPYDPEGSSYEVRMLEPGAYRTALITDGTHATATITLDGLAGSASHVASEPVHHATFAAQDPAPAGTGAYGVGDVAELLTSGRVYVAQWFKGIGAVRHDGLCITRDPSPGFAPMIDLPQCPSGTESSSTSTTVGGVVGTLSEASWGNAPPGSYALGGWSTSATVAKSQGVIAYWLDGP